MRPRIQTVFVLILCTGLLSLGGSAFAQDRSAEEDRLLKSDPQQLLDLSQDMGNSIVLTSLADFGKRDVREAPGHVQVITAREIQASGAKDLYDVLQLVPGLSFGQNRDDRTEVGIHGNWAAEGRCLFLLDGVELNENDFGGHGIDQRIPLVNVDHIEVLMGPGSVMHGGYALLGVINIVSRSADQGTGARASVRSGHANDNITSTAESVSGSHRLSRDQDISYMANFERGRRSNTMRLMPDSTWLNFGDSTGMQSTSFQFSYRWRGFRASVAYMEQTYALSDKPADLLSRDVLLNLEYTKRFSDKWSMTWYLNQTDQLPGNHVNTLDTTLLWRNTSNQRTSTRGTLTFRPANWISLNLGVQGYHQRTAQLLRTPQSRSNLDEDPIITMNDGAVFGEVRVAGKPGILSAGYRIENNDLAGVFTAHNLAYAKVFGPVNVKLMWGSAFRIPTVMNLTYGPADETLKTEYATTKQAALGVKLAKVITMTVNVYETRIKDPIATVFDPVSEVYYVNKDAAGTSGLDARIGLMTKRTTCIAGFGANTPVQTETDALQVDSADRHVIGLPAKKAYVVLAWDALPKLTLRGKATWKGITCTHFNSNSAHGFEGLVPWPEELIFNAGLTWRPKDSGRTSIDVDCANLTDVDRTIAGPVGNNVTPFALNGRTWNLAITYKFIQ